jgi:hypothetical protein
MTYENSTREREQENGGKYAATTARTRRRRSDLQSHAAILQRRFAVESIGEKPVPMGAGQWGESEVRCRGGQRGEPRRTNRRLHYLANAKFSAGREYSRRIRLSMDDGDWRGSLGRWAGSRRLGCHAYQQQRQEKPYAQHLSPLGPKYARNCALIPVPGPLKSIDD